MIAPGEHPLAVLAAHPDNPFLQEWALLLLAKKLLRAHRNGNDMPANGQSLLLLSSDWQAWVNGDALLDNDKDNLTFSLRPRHYIDHRWEIPSFVASEQKWRYRLGQLLRFALTGQQDFARRSRLTPPPRRTGGYRGVRSHWFRTRYGHFNGQADFGPTWVALSDWAVNLLCRLLEWPGFMRHFNGGGPSLPEDFSADELLRVIDRRLDELRASFGRASGTPIYRVRVNWNDLRRRDGDPQYARTLRVAVVQSALPNIDTFIASPADPTLSSPNVYRTMSVHFSAVLSGLERMLQVRRTHVDGPPQPDLIIFPELALHPQLYWSQLRRFALQWLAMVFVGMVYHPRVSGSTDLINSGYWILPYATDSAGPDLRVIEQGKQHLMRDEQRYARDARRAGGGNIRGFRPCQWIVELAESSTSDPIFEMSAAICFDATDLRLATDLRDQKTDLFIVSALNRDVKTFDNMITAMNYHMFQPVVLANNGTFGGSGAQWPINEPRHERTLFHTHGGDQMTVNFFDLDMEFVRQRRSRARANASRTFKSPPAGI
jgi:hypothetical protein